MTANRRQFLKSVVTTGTLALGAGVFLPACSGIRRADLSLEKADGKHKQINNLDAIGKNILYYASLAPSGHNLQPWYVKIIKENEWVIGADPERRLPVVDPDNRQVLLSIGAFIENLAIAARAFGLEAELEVIGRQFTDQDLVRISLQKSKATAYPLERISKRLTAKQGYRNEEIKSGDIKALSKTLGNGLFYFPRGSQHANCIAEGAVENFRIQTHRNDAQLETARWLRLSNAAAEKYRDGLTAESMEIQGIKGWFVRNFVSPEDFISESFRQQAIDHTAKLAGQGGGWLIITSDSGGVEGLIEAGRRFERMALLARERGIAIHPLTQYLEETDGRQEIAANHRADMIPQFVLRVGYLSNYPDPVSLRRPVGWFVRS